MTDDHFAATPHTYISVICIVERAVNAPPCFADVEHNAPLKTDAEDEERLFLLSIRITLVIPSDFKAVGARGAQALRAKAPSSYCIIPLSAG
jgi:hypothetical protein